MSEDTHDATVAEAILGDEARKFMESDLCRYMIGMAEQDVQFALEKLGEVDPFNHEEIMKLQFEVKVALKFPQWLKDAVDRGDSALSILTDQEQKT